MGTGQELHAIVNPVSGAGRTRRLWPRLAARLSAAGVRVRETFTRAPGDATRIAREFLRRGVVEILSVGGDGTANEVANAFFEDGKPVAPGACLAILPTGTGRDFARSLGIRSRSEAVRAALRGVLRRIDVGCLTFGREGRSGERYFVNAADVGLGATAADLINRSSKVLGGILTYLLGAVRAALSYEGAHVRVVVDGRPLHDGPTEMVLIANGRYHAGGMKMAPSASMDDGAFEVLVLERISRAALLFGLLPRVYVGRHLSHPRIRYARGSDVQVFAEKAVPFECDGEQPGTTDLRARILPLALAVRAPAFSAERVGG